MIPFSEINWNQLRCAYTSGIKKLPEQLARIQVTNDYEEIKHILSEILIYHNQCGFYNSTIVVISYLIEFVKQRNTDFKYSMTLIPYISLLYSSKENIEGIIIDMNLKQWYNKNIAYIKTHLLNLIEEHYKDIITFSKENTKLSLISFMSLLDTTPFAARIAKQISSDNFITLPIECINCDFEDGIFPIYNKSITPAKVNLTNWNKKDFSNTPVWIYNIYQDVLEDEIIKWSLQITGTFTCPNCGKKQSTIASVANFWEQWKQFVSNPDNLIDID